MTWRDEMTRLHEKSYEELLEMEQEAHKEVLFWRRVVTWSVAAGCIFLVLTFVFAFLAMVTV